MAHEIDPEVGTGRDGGALEIDVVSKSERVSAATWLPAASASLHRDERFGPSDEEVEAELEALVVATGDVINHTPKVVVAGHSKIEDIRRATSKRLHRLSATTSRDKAERSRKIAAMTS